MYGIECSIPGISESWMGLLDRDLKQRVSQVRYKPYFRSIYIGIVDNVCSHPPFVFQTSDTGKIAVYFLETSAKAIENSHAHLQSCFRELCEAAIKKQCQVKSPFEAERIMLFMQFCIIVLCITLFFSLQFIR